MTLDTVSHNANTPMYLSLVVRKPVFEVSDQSDTNRVVQPQKMASGC